MIRLLLSRAQIKQTSEHKANKLIWADHSRQWANKCKGQRTMLAGRKARSPVWWSEWWKQREGQVLGDFDAIVRIWIIIIFL